MGRSIAEQRHQNHVRVFGKIWESDRSYNNQFDGVSRQDVAKAATLSLTATNAILADLLREGLVVEEEVSTGSVGRPAIRLHVAPKRHMVVAVDVGRYWTVVGFFDLAGNPLALSDGRPRITFQTSRANDDPKTAPQTNLRWLERCIQTALDFAPLARDRLIGVGLAVPGPVRTDTGEFFNVTDFGDFGSLKVREELARHFELQLEQVRIDNDARACALAHRWFGLGRDTPNYVYLSVTDGVGGGIILGGDVFRGANYLAGELGHTTIDTLGLLCQCGHRGCLETVATMTKTVERWHDLQGRAEKDRPAHRNDPERHDSARKEFLEAAMGHDEAARAARHALERTGDFLGIGVVNIVNSFDPEKIIVGRDLGEAGDILLNRIREKVREHALAVRSGGRSIEIVKDNLPEPSLLGAACMILHEVAYTGDLIDIVRASGPMGEQSRVKTTASDAQGRPGDTVPLSTLTLGEGTSLTVPAAKKVAARRGTILTALATKKVAPNILTPTYRRDQLEQAIVHLGVGGFHRAHQAVYLDDLAERGITNEWGECGVGLLPRDRAMADALLPQQCLYTVVERGTDEDKARVVGSMTGYLFAPENPERVLAKLSDARTRIVSVTITERGYNIDWTSGEFDAANPDIQEDVRHPSTPSTAVGYICEALARRRSAGIAPFTVLSCDNLQGNGAVASKAILSFAALRDDALSAWIEANMAFPNTMMDRITPRTTDADRETVARIFGIDDAWPVVTEPFKQWVIEDTFCNGRPPLEKVDAQLVRDVYPYEAMKMRLLNGSHLAIGYLGYLAGYRYMADAMSDVMFWEFITRMMDDEVGPLLPPVPGIVLDDYKRSLIDRFGNKRIGDQIQRICRDGSVSMPKCLLPSIAEALASGRPHRLLTLALAGWFRYLGGEDERHVRITIEDPLKDRLTELAKKSKDDPRPLLGERRIFGDLGQNEAFVASLTDTLHDLYAKGAAATLSAYCR